MSEDEYMVRIRALFQLLNELKILINSMEQRIAAAEQSLSGRWMQ